MTGICLHLLGHEGAGVVEKIGPGVSKVDVGSKVILHWKQSEGINASPPNFDYNGKVINAGLVTTFSEYSIVSENRITLMPAGLGFAEAACTDVPSQPDLELFEMMQKFRWEIMLLFLVPEELD